MEFVLLCFFLFWVLALGVIAFLISPLKMEKKKGPYFVHTDRPADEDLVAEVGYSQIRDNYSESDNEAEGAVHVDGGDDRRRRRHIDNNDENIAAGNNTRIIRINGMEIYIHGPLDGIEQFPDYYSEQQIVTLDPNHGQQTVVNNNRHQSLDCDSLENLDHSFEQTLSFNIDDVGRAGDRENQEDEGGRAEGVERERGRVVNETLHWAAPLPAARCEIIKNAMQHISLGGFRPDWANHIPEDQWVSCLKNRRNMSFR
jgi:hypothetical protein